MEQLSFKQFKFLSMNSIIVEYLKMSALESTEVNSP